MRQLRNIVSASPLCPKCDGSGLVDNGKGGLKVCDKCGGTGLKK